MPANRDRRVVSSVMRALLIVALLSSSSAHADVTRKDVVAALVKGDVEALRVAAEFPLVAMAVWFDTTACKTFTSPTTVKISEAELPAFVKCLADLSPRAEGEPGNEFVMYGAGTILSPYVAVRNGKPRLRAFSGLAMKDAVDRDDAAPIDPKTFTSKIAGFSRVVPPAPNDRKRLDASSSERTSAKVRICVGTTGAVEHVLVTDVFGDVPDYGAHVEKVVRGWKSTAFQLRGKPARACARFFVGYPESRMHQIELAVAPPPPPPPPLMPGGDTQNIAPTLLEGLRKSGNKNILPDDATKTKIAEDGKDKVISSWKLCIATSGVVTTVKQIRSSGYPAYDKLIESEMTKWSYNPYKVNGKAVPVCTAVTFIYAQK
jgi:hypothetical protein